MRKYILFYYLIFLCFYFDVIVYIFSNFSHFKLNSIYIAENNDGKTYIYIVNRNSV